VSPSPEPAEASARAALDRVFREEHAVIVGALLRRFGDVDLAEDAAAEALEEALQHWPAEGVPANPGAWLTTTAKRKALDRLRRESTRPAREQESNTMRTHHEPPLGVIDDDRLRLLFLCCHPALSLDTRVPLTLRLVSGLTVAEIAAALLVEERALAQRITRAKRKIRDAHIAFRIPERDDLPARVGGVLASLFLLYSEGYLTHSDAQAVRDDLCVEAIRLARLVVDLVPGDPEAPALLALLLLTQARRPARLGGSGLVLFEDQDRGAWDRALLVEGLDLATRLLDAPGTPGPYRVMATIAATHASAPPAGVDWTMIVALYDRLMEVGATPVVALNRAVAVSHVDGPAAALALVEPLALDGYPPFHVVRADLLERLGRRDDARDAVATALTVVRNRLERAHLEARLRELS
jgi:RNA polymerase sigma-70 factor (ECF subfamily)